MKKYKLTAGHIPGFSDSFHQMDDHAAVADASGYIRCFIKPDPTKHVGRDFELNEDRGDEIFDETTFVGSSRIEERDSKIDQKWQVQARRWRHTARDMSVSDPHEGGPEA